MRGSFRSMTSTSSMCPLAASCCLSRWWLCLHAAGVCSGPSGLASAGRGHIACDSLLPILMCEQLKHARQVMLAILGLQCVRCLLVCAGPVGGCSSRLPHLCSWQFRCSFVDCTHLCTGVLCCVAVVWPCHSRACRCTASQAVSLVFFLLPNAYILANGKDLPRRCDSSICTMQLHVHLNLLQRTSWPPMMHDRRVLLV